MARLFDVARLGAVGCVICCGLAWTPRPAQAAGSSDIDGATHLISGSGAGLLAMLRERGWRRTDNLCAGSTRCEPNGSQPGVQVYTRHHGDGGVEQVAYVWPVTEPRHNGPEWAVCVADADVDAVDLSEDLCSDARDDFSADLASGLALLRRHAGRTPWSELRHGIGEIDAYLQKTPEPPPAPADAPAGVDRCDTQQPAPSVAASLTCEAWMPAAVPLQRDLLDTVIWRDNADDKLIALTFDACSTFFHGNYNRRVIDILLRHHVPATLFIGGHWAEMHPTELQELAAYSQFELGNHTYSHPHMTQLPPQRQREELLWTQYLIYKLTGQTPRFYRPPYGEISDQTIYEAAKLGLYTIEYDLPAGDADIHVSARRLIQWVVGRASSGSIVIMHMNHPESKTAEILPEVIRSLRARGYRLAKVSELLAHMEAQMPVAAPRPGPLAEDEDEAPTLPNASFDP